MDGRVSTSRFSRSEILTKENIIGGAHRLYSMVPIFEKKNYFTKSVRRKFALLQKLNSTKPYYACSLDLPFYIHQSHLPVHHCTDSPSGAAYSNVQVTWMKITKLLDSSLHPTCMPVAHSEDGGSLLSCFCL